jgi:EmrB/QacA subfamily drug resistance transporter
MTNDPVPTAPKSASAPPARIGPVFGGLMLAMVLASLDQTIVSTALPTIVGELGGFTQLSWVVTAYLLTSTVSTPIYGKLGDLYGRKKIFLFSIVVFLVGSALCGLSQDIGQLIASRALQGVGGGGLMVGAQAIIADVVSPRERGRYSGYFGAVFGFTSIAGPLIGGFIVDHTSWRWVFYINLPLGVLVLLVISAVLPSPDGRVRHRIDYLGTALLSCGVVCIVLVTTWGGTQYAWGSPVVVGLGIGAVVTLALFALVERRAAEPVIPLLLFRSRVFTVCSLMGLVVGFSLFGAVTYLPQYQQIVKGASPTSSGLQLLPLMAGVLLTSIGSGQLITRSGRYKIFPIVGTAVMTVAMLLLSRLAPETPEPMAWLSMFLLGAGLGLVTQVLVLAVQNAVAPSELGTATSAVTFFRSIGGAVGVSVFSAIFTAQFAGNLATALSPGAAAQLGGTGHITPDLVAQLPAPVRSGVVQAFSDALDTVFLAAVPFTVVAFALSWALPEVPLRSGAAPMDGVAEGFGMVRSGAADVLEETQARIGAARAALDRLDDIAARDGLDPAQAEPLRQLFGGRIAYLCEQARLAGDGTATMSPRGWRLAQQMLEADRQTLASDVTGAPPGGTHAVRRRLGQEAGARLRAARSALHRLDELAPSSGVPEEQVAALRTLFESRVARIEATVEHARSSATAQSRPAAFWRVAAELLAVERRTLTDWARTATVTAGVADRAEHDLAAEQGELLGTTTAAAR